MVMRVAGVVAVLVGLAVLTVGTGALGLETRTFTRISCGSVEVKGGTVWHCSGESPEQVRANDAALREAEQAALRVGAPLRFRQPQRTRLTFVAHDGRNDPPQVTATRLPGDGRWIAHSGEVVGTGLGLVLFGGAVLVFQWRPVMGQRSTAKPSSTT
ncbi:hypothetical protein ACIBEJ_46555 [Nonomuraea sp. NPDC050790]|uniref:hypothetical protein n=1 Tax=Nonomuraea sp. NPDC050790 TaxID=3364371 RepID=UPI0037B0BBD7